MMPKLTIGMACHADFDGVYFTLQSLRLHHAEVMAEVELIVVDNAPHLPEGPRVRSLVEGPARVGTAGARYIPMPEAVGTTQPRQRIFDEAAGDAVLVCDCHVLFAPGSIRRLIEFYDDNPDCGNLLSGPMIMDDLVGTATHFNHVWEAEMWGKWSSAWECSCGKTRFHAIEGDRRAFLCRLDGSPYPGCDCTPALPAMPWAGHERILEADPFSSRRIGTDPDDPPFEIPAMGLGAFSCRRDAWVGFNPHMRGFGGEEHYIHEKFRQAGRKCTCVPFLRWLHRFGRTNGARYPLSVWNKVRNYVLGHHELGLDLAPIEREFVDTGRMPRGEWEQLIADPVACTMPRIAHTGGCGGCEKDIAEMDVDGVYEYFRPRAADFGEHYPKLKELAGLCDHVSEIGKREYGVPALAAGRPNRLRSYNSQQQGAAYWRLEAIAAEDSDFDLLITHEDPLSADMEETDLLFIDSKHNYAQLHAELTRHADKVRRFIVLHDTETFGFDGEGGGPGLKPALIRFMRHNCEWSVVYSTTVQHGLMVLSRNPDDKPRRPGVVEMAAKYLKHTAEHVAAGAEMVSPEQLQARLETCWLCDLRTDSEACSMCGCPLVPKAKRKAGYCDANKWIEVDAEFAAEIAE